MARVGEEWRNEVAETGHYERPGDIDLIADLGLRTVRYPILWEMVAPDRPDRCDFSWFDARLAALRERGIEVIGGLMHHGSGPHYTDLLDPALPAKLADFAGRAAERYPWITRWTPVNEPLTTARFSGLYGHWYPHRTDMRSMFRALVNQCAATAAAMRAIRQVIAGAQLVQTEDLGKTFATPRLAYQAEYENERRWLSLDLLCGRVDEAHPLRRELIDHGISADELDAFLDGAATPDLLGINHYLTSERFLDDRVEQYPGHDAGGNGRDRYVDVEAVRIEALHGLTGIAPRLREAWERYGIPIAVTEVHHGCTREEQLRWFAEVWHECQAERERGTDVRAITLWSLFGNVDWRSLLTRRDGIYDVGAFDMRAPRPRPTVIAAAAKAFASDEAFAHPVLDVPGWWRRPERLYPWQDACQSLGTEGRHLLITGATGTLGRATARIAQHRGLPFCLTNRDELDIAYPASVEAAIERYKPWAIINTAGFVRVADAEREQDACMRWNADGPEVLGRACADAGIPLVTYSSDLVFNGKLGLPYVEDDPVSPANVYGASKAEAERRLANLPNSLILRTSAFFGPWDEHNFAWHVLRTLERGEPFRASRSDIVSPTYVPDLCHATLDLLIDGECGIWHVANQGSLSWHEFACRIAEGAGYDRTMVLPIEGTGTDTTMESRRGTLLRPIDHAIHAYLADTRQLAPPPEELLAAE